MRLFERRNVDICWENATLVVGTYESGTRFRSKRILIPHTAVLMLLRMPIAEAFDEWKANVAFSAALGTRQRPHRLMLLFGNALRREQLARVF